MDESPGGVVVGSGDARLIFSHPWPAHGKAEYLSITLKLKGLRVGRGATR